MYADKLVRCETGVYVTFNGTRGIPTTSLVSAQKKFGIEFVLRSKSFLLGVDLKMPLPSGPYFLEPATGNIFEGQIPRRVSVRGLVSE